MVLPTTLMPIIRFFTRLTSHSHIQGEGSVKHNVPDRVYCNRSYILSPLLASLAGFSIVHSAPWKGIELSEVKYCYHTIDFPSELSKNPCNPSSASTSSLFSLSHSALITL